jgi:hypothetical protein
LGAGISAIDAREAPHHSLRSLLLGPSWCFWFSYCFSDTCPDELDTTEVVPLFCSRAVAVLNVRPWLAVCCLLSGLCHALSKSQTSSALGPMSLVRSYPHLLGAAKGVSWRGGRRRVHAAPPVTGAGVPSCTCTSPWQVAPRTRTATNNVVGSGPRAGGLGLEATASHSPQPTAHSPAPPTHVSARCPVRALGTPSRRRATAAPTHPLSYLGNAVVMPIKPI